MIIAVGKRVHCSYRGRPRLVRVSEQGGEIGANFEEGTQCGEGAFEARVEYVRLVKRWVRRRRAA